MKYLFVCTLMAVLLTINGCDYLEDLSDGSSSGGTEPIASTEDENTQDSDTETATSDIEEEKIIKASTVTLSAFSDFSCSSNWTERDGALGLEANSGSGSCENTFSGVTTAYRITITIQTEFDGKPYYSLSIGGREVDSGHYPLSSSLGCECPKDNWWNVCPDQNVEIDAGVHTVVNGDVITFYGEEDWQCDGHGAYAKWHKITLVPDN